MRTRKIQIGWAAVGIGLLALNVAQGAMVELRSGKTMEGSDIRAKPNGEISLTTPQGVMVFTRDQYVRAVADKPAAIDQGIAAVRAKDYDKGIKLFEDVIKQYRYLDWDNQARLLLAKTYEEKGDAASAAKTYELLMASDAASKDNADVQWAYRQALLSAGSYDKLLPMLDQVIQQGTRADAARAQIMRGDIEQAKGNTEDALLDYLRTVMLFKAQTDQQPEALYKAASALNQLRDKRAQDLYTQLKQEYPNSPYAQRPLGK